MDFNKDVQKKVEPGLDKARQRQSVREAFQGLRARQKANPVPSMEDRKARLRAVREASVGNQALFDQALTRFKANSFKVFVADTREDALSFILQEIGDEKLLVKSKSNVSKELGLTEFLGERGVTVVETDIGDRINQLAGDPPTHPIIPAVHLSRHDIAGIMSKHVGRPVAPSPVALSMLTRDDVSAAIDKARIGITGANGLAAEEGMVALWHNEGNIWRVMMRPGKHIVLAGIDKIYPNLDEVANLARIQAFHATGQIAPNFMNIIGGPSRTADIEMQLVQGVHGPTEVVLVLVDNGRSRVMQSEFRELLYCIGCGACLLECPAYSTYGPRYASGADLGGKGLMKASLVHGREMAKHDMNRCLTCGHCKAICPLSLDVPGMIARLRAKGTFAKGWRFAEAHAQWARDSIYLESLLMVDAVLQGKD